MSNEYSEDSDEITDKDSWKIISSYFNQHCLVFQKNILIQPIYIKNIKTISDENKTINIE